MLNTDVALFFFQIFSFNGWLNPRMQNPQIKGLTSCQLLLVIVYKVMLKQVDDTPMLSCNDQP
jgi:hypothetical protein